MSRKLVVFDVDGTLVDSQAEILGAMNAGFSDLGLMAPGRDEILSIVGLSLPQAMAQLAPDLPLADQTRLAEEYKRAYMAARLAGAVPPFYPGMRELLDTLAERDDLLLGVATGKSRRGLTSLIESHGLAGHFVTTQVADDHPSKPHPSMLMAALTEADVEADAAVMIGDTSYDIQMGHGARMATIGVTWGYHPRAALEAASMVVDRVDDLGDVIDLALGGIC
jgi:phosphoglycolate phosphatase